jgi:hypothetical protein
LVFYERWVELDGSSVCICYVNLTVWVLTPTKVHTNRLLEAMQVPPMEPLEHRVHEEGNLEHSTDEGNAYAGGLACGCWCVSCASEWAGSREYQRRDAEHSTRLCGKSCAVGGGGEEADDCLIGRVVVLLSIIQWCFGEDIALAVHLQGPASLIFECLAGGEVSLEIGREAIGRSCRRFGRIMWGSGRELLCFPRKSRAQISGSRSAPDSAHA